MSALFTNFLKGLLVMVPTVCTVYVVWFSFVTLDRLIPGPIPGTGIVIGFLATAFVGAFASNVIGKRLFAITDRLLTGVPLVKLLYTALRDFVGALVGDRKTFDQPVVVSLTEGDSSAKMMGFVTCADMERFGLVDHVAVYFPQSINFAGNLVVFPSHRVARVDVDHAQFMAFVVSGGVVSGVPT